MGVLKLHGAVVIIVVMLALAGKFNVMSEVHPNLAQVSKNTPAKWETLQSLSNELRIVITGDCRDARDLALKDTQEIRVVFLEILEAACVAALAQSDRLNEGVKTEDLTLKQVDDIFEELHQIDVQFRADVKEPLEEFSVKIRLEIQRVMLHYRTTVGAIGDAVKVLLDIPDI